MSPNDAWMMVSIALYLSLSGTAPQQHCYKWLVYYVFFIERDEEQNSLCASDKKSGKHLWLDMWDATISRAVYIIKNNTDLVEVRCYGGDDCLDVNICCEAERIDEQSWHYNHDTRPSMCQQYCDTKSFYQGLFYTNI